MSSRALGTVRLYFGPVEYKSYTKFTAEYGLVHVGELFDLAAALMRWANQEYNRGRIIASMAADEKTFSPMLLVGRDQDFKQQVQFVAIPEDVSDIGTRSYLKISPRRRNLVAWQRMQKSLELESVTDFMRASIAVLKWAKKEVEDGRAIVSVDQSHSRLGVLEFDFLDKKPAP